jgi:hypothetical protein
MARWKYASTAIWQHLVMTGKRTLWDFLVTPVKDSFARAFREQ